MFAKILIALALVNAAAAQEQPTAADKLPDTDATRQRCQGGEPSITRAPFGKTKDGIPVESYTLCNSRGMHARIATYGGIVTHLTAPDRAGKYSDVVLGYDTLEGYLEDSPYFGALIGRYGNRIAKGKFELNGKVYSLATNNGPNALHGGRVGFDKVVWAATKADVTAHGPRLTLKYVSRDGEEAYPGTLSVTAVYTLTNDNALSLEYEATTDKETVANLTQHSYFNLRGRGDILGHTLQINGHSFTPVDSTLIPTGQIRSVQGTPFDFRRATKIGERIDAEDEQMRFGRGYDHNWVINGHVGRMRAMARVYEPETGRVLEVLSNAPGLQFYSGNFLDGSIVGKGGWRYEFRNGFCLEPQHFPDSPNHPQFPSTTLKPGQIYRHTIVYRFTTQRPRADVDGTVYVPAFALPESSLLDEKTRSGLKKVRESQGVTAASCPGADAADPAATRKVRECQADAFAASAFYKQFRDRYAVTVTPQRLGGVYTEVFTPQDGITPKNKNRVLINVHGGHFKNGSRTISHLESIPIASIGKIKVISIDYRMAPEYGFPAASEDVAVVYRELLKTYRPQNMGLYGCSAGSLLTAQSMAWLQKEGLPLPAAVGMFGGGASYYQEGDSAPLSSAITGVPLEPRSEHPYFKATDAKDPLAFPIRSKQILAKFPPSLLIATTRDIGLSAAVYTHSELVKLGVDAQLHVWEGLAHCFFNAWDVPEADEVHEIIVRFFDRHLGK